ncbi:ribosomal protein S6 kinase beta [Colletotrichum spaethianum]|uniref:Ribosomal protein S6 kinase beta n=1 Tax=Colletotrichum spaethianum TaxID=700344 RepID=A0AA37PGM0_9PEZI|nr:ribosomal protein S6 kinase beta [Colletotrichum spaethianum]GKT51804.1 ribosomal protein S6 kinase beta [Colletotrichum spaethianum]
MENLPLYDIARWQVHETEDDCDLIIRTNNGRAFYCTVSPSHFHRSPKLTDQYFKCLHLLRSGEEEQDDFYIEDAYNWLSKPFEPLIAQLSPSSLAVTDNGRPRLSQYLFPPYFVCGLEAADEVLRPYQVQTQNHGWSSPVVVVKDDILTDLDQWAKSYHPSDVEIMYNRSEDILIKRPTKVLVDSGNGSQVKCYFKRFGLSFGPAHAKKELTTLKAIVMAQIPPPPEAWICRLHGVVRDGDKLMGMLFVWIDTKGVLSKARADQSSPDLRKRWKTQISTSLEKLHQKGIIWGDVKAENVLIDSDDNAWIIDFGGSYTPGWVDKEKAGTLAGDAQGLEKILDILC